MKRTTAAGLLLFLLGAAPLGAQAKKGDAAGLQALLNPSPRPFRLSAGDVIQIKFFYNPELEDVIQIRPDGMISMPLVGEIQVGGLTVSEARALIEESYRRTLKNPSATLQVREYASQKVYVGGEVLRPGVVPLRSELRLLEALMEAGGAKPTASSSTLVLIRKSSRGQPLRYELSLKSKEGEPAAASIPLQPFDVVLVPESGIARVDRWVDQHVRQLLPLTLTAGFTYLKSATALVIP